MRVLVVEDEVRQAAALKRGLEAEGFAVDVAGTGTDGLWLPPQQAPHARRVVARHRTGLRRDRARRDAARAQRLQGVCTVARQADLDAGADVDRQGRRV